MLKNDRKKNYGRTKQKIIKDRKKVQKFLESKNLLRKKHFINK